MAEKEVQADPIHLFYSYEQRDEELRNELEKHLSVLRQQGHIAQWHHRNISAGTDWRRQVDTHLEIAHIILLLISADFLASEYCYSVEMKQALERHDTGFTQVIPILLRPVDWQEAPFARLQILPRNGRPVTTWLNQDQAYQHIAIEIRAAVAELKKKRTPFQMNATEITHPQTLLRDVLQQKSTLREWREGGEQVLTVSKGFVASLNNLRCIQKRVNELISIHSMLREIELQLEGLTATIQIQLILHRDKTEKTSSRGIFVKKELINDSVNLSIIEIVWRQVRQKIDNLKYFAAVEMEVLDEERFSFDKDVVSGPLWITEIFILQNSFEASIQACNVKEMNSVAQNLLEKSRSHLYLLDKQLLKAVKDLDTISDYILRSIQ